MSILLCLFPFLVMIVECVGLRWLLHFVIEWRPGFFYFTDSDFIFPLPFAYFSVMFALSQKQDFSLKFNRKWLVGHLFFLISFIGFCFWMKSQGVLNGTGLTVTGWGLVFATLVSSFFVWISPRFFLLNPNRMAILPGSLMALSVVFAQNTPSLIWREAIPLLARSARFLTSVFGFEGLRILGLKDLLVIADPNFMLHVGQGCAGFDSIYLGISFFAWVAPWYWSVFSHHSWFFIFLATTCFMIFLNLLRIILMVVTARWAFFIGGQPFLKSVLELFHWHAGYLIYVVGLLGVFLVLQFLMRKKAKVSPAWNLIPVEESV